jgi:RNA polymerase-binding transcription factor DksA
MSKMALTADDRKAFRRRLLELTRRVSGEVAQLEDEVMRPTGSEGTAADAPTHEPVPSGSEADGEVARTVLSTEEQILSEVHAAIHRLDKGTFGKCEQCGRPITRERLNAIPYARQCISCARTANPEPD